MEISVQPKILKAIEEKQVVRLGGYEPIKTDIKIVSAVNENPLQCIAENKLREDLFYRLSVVQLNIPPLRERINDLFYLVSHFINIYNTSMHCNLIGIDEEVETIFRGYNWPGNVRELKNVIEGAFNVASARFIQKKDLPEYLTRPFVLEEIGQNALMTVPAIPLKGISLEEALETYERELIEHAVAISKNYVEAAKLLGITKQALNYKLRKYKLRE